MRRTLARGVLRAALCLLLLALVGRVLLPLGARRLAPRAFPQTQGVVRVVGLQEPVTVARDPWGVAHIFAATAHDLFFAQGYVHAQERFWQMDVRRRMAQGRLAEWFGPAFIATDRFFRTLDLRRVAWAEWRSLPPQEQAVLRAYAAGVNAYLRQRPPDRVALGYALLAAVPGLQPQPEPWSPVDTLLWVKLMAWHLGSNVTQELERALLLRSLSPAQIEQLYPPYPYDLPVIVPFFPIGEPARPLPPPPDLPRAAGHVLERTARAMRTLQRQTGLAGGPWGSNAWVVGPTHTVTGRPLLAADPHLPYEQPPVWYAIALHCRPPSAACPYEVAGVSFPGVPGVVMGHNGQVAWAFSNLIPDVMDLVIEAVDPADPSRYRTPEGWAHFRVRTETLQVAGWPAVTFQVRETRNGPVLSDWARAFQPQGPFWNRRPFEQRVGLPLPEPYAVSLRWTGLQPGTALRAFLGFMRAQNWEDFRAAARWFDTPAQNIVYADGHGTIAYQMPGKIPLRANNDGRWPALGWRADHEWLGYIPWEHLPYRVDPPEGYIVTANQRAVPFDYPYYVAWDWAYGFRAQRIEQALGERLRRGPLSVADMMALQLDDASTKWPILRPYVLALRPTSPAQARALALLQRWDGRMRADSPAALLFAAFWKALLRLTFDEIPAEQEPRLRIHGGNRWQQVLRDLLPRSGDPWWDVRATPARETRDQVLRQALEQAWLHTRRAWGPAVAWWQWGRAHQVTLGEPSLGRLSWLGLRAVYAVGPFPVGGDTAAVNAQVWDAAGEDFAALGGPTLRLVLDVGAWDRAVMALAGGQSGHPGHRHYGDGAAWWARGAYHPLVWSEARLWALDPEVLRLEPAR